MERKYLRNFEEQELVFKRFKHKCLKIGSGKNFDKELYDQLDLKIGKDTIGEIIEKSYTLGRCYFYALLLAKGLKGSTLVHGILHKLDVSVRDEYYEEFVHAWVEKGEYVFDTTAKMVFLKDEYYERLRAEAKVSYSQKNLAENISFVKLAEDAVALRPVLKSRLEKICSEWKLPYQADRIETKNANNQIEK